MKTFILFSLISLNSFARDVVFRMTERAAVTNETSTKASCLLAHDEVYQRAQMQCARLSGNVSGIIYNANVISKSKCEVTAEYGCKIIDL